MSVKEILQKTRTLLDTDIFQLKKKLVIMSFVLRYFLMGVEYSIILPTALLYMKTFNAGPFITGVTIAAYPVAAMISLPVFGYFYDRTKRTRELLLILNLFEILGNLIYALPYSIWLPGIGRFLAGVGDGFMALTVGEITYLYPERYRLGILSLLEFGRVLGLILGPSFNFLIEGKTIVLQTWILDDNTLPGVIMAILWTILEVLTFFCVFNLAKELIDLNISPETEKEHFLYVQEEELEDKGYTEEDDEDDEENKNFQEQSKIHFNLLEDQVIKNEEKVSRHSSDESLFHPTFAKKSYVSRRKANEIDGNANEEDDSGSITSEKSSSSVKEENEPVGRGVFHEHKEKTKEFWISNLKEIFCVEFLIVTLTDFTLWFCQTNFEILAPYVTEFDYKWTPQQTGMIYVFGGILVILVFLLMYVLGAKCNIKDSHLLIVSLVCTQISLALLMLESTMKKTVITEKGTTIMDTNLSKRVPVFAAVSVFVFISIPLNLVCSKNLISKLFLPELMGTVQGISSGVARITMITGPIISGYIFKDRIAYGGIVSVFNFAVLIAFFSLLSQIHKRQRKIKRELRINGKNHHHQHHRHHHHKQRSSPSH